MLQPNRHGGENYRFGFGSHENDNEVKGKGNHMSFGNYGYDTRLMRRFNIDPMIGEYPHMSPYAVFNNNPIYFAAPTGLSPEPYPSWIEGGLFLKMQWAYTSAAKFDIENNQMSFKKMDALEGHSRFVFNSYHFHRVTSFHRQNALKEKGYHDGLIPEGSDPARCYLKCSPSLNGMINRLYNWKGSDKIYKTEVEGKNSIMSTMKKKGLTSSEKVFSGQDDDGNTSHFSKNDPTKLSSSIANWAESNTGKNGVGFFLISVAGGYHSLMLVADRRGGKTTYRLLDQHGNNNTGSSSSFDRLKSHSSSEMDNYFLQMLRSWYDVDRDGDGDKDYNANVKVVKLKRD